MTLAMRLLCTFVLIGAAWLCFDVARRHRPRAVPIVNIAQRLARPPRPIVVTCGACHTALCVVHSARDAAIEDELHRLLCHQAAA